MRVPYRTTWELAEELVAYGPAVVVVAPEELRHAVLSLLRDAARLDSVEQDRGEAG